MNSLTEDIKQHITDVRDFPKEGILYKDISSLFLNTELCHRIVLEFVKFSKNKVDAVCGIESRGFLFGPQIAQLLNVPFIMIRKSGKLPPPVVSKNYNLEYNKATIEIKKHFISQGQRILIHDDILATGGTAKACAELITECGGIATQFSFIAELSFLNGTQTLLPHCNEIHSLVSY
ncbi:adenine phosphoribosyltransferase [Apibacter muscae]|uniref:Adenine phosphoribosyltransferase n=1 Tax=Apibacter muscae TaxID=2509004 RepID=A0A563DDI4_9FLAO|nr:adenine phosphoribosyltransferase [Apibacter muscae]TWP27844.1 adenine phosphoribosyltransferase [Apibacter muscae]